MSAPSQVPLEAALFGIPMGPELVVIALVLVLPISATYWVYSDATARGRDDAGLWAALVGVLWLFTFFGGILALVVYVTKRE